MRIFVLGLNYAPEPVGIGPYTQGMAEMLADRGHTVHVLAGKPYYPQWKIYPDYRTLRSRTENGVSIRRVPHYVPREPNGVRRIMHHLSFALSALPYACVEALRFKPDLVVTIAPSLVASPVAQIAAGLSGASSWLLVQDFEVEAAFATGLIRADSMLGRIALAFQSRVFRRFDVCSSISPRMCAKLRALGVPANRVVEFGNWSEVASLPLLNGPSVYRDKWNIHTPNVALYSGNIANKQGIEIVIEAARKLRDRTDISFVICGDGPQKAQLMVSAADLPNVQFHDLQPAERLRDLLSLATIHLLPQLGDAADLVLPSKLANMLASGRPIVSTADPGTDLGREVQGRGLCTPPGDATAFAHAIASLADDKTRSAVLGAAARRRAEDRWTREAIFKEFLARIEQLGRRSRRERRVPSV